MQSRRSSVSVLYVCWKSRGSPAARGRISVQLSMDDLPIEFPEEPKQAPQPARRGWWDYVSEERPVDGPERSTKGGLFSGIVSLLIDSNITVH